MGDEAVGDRGRVAELEIGMPGLEEAAAELASRHGLEVTPDLKALIDGLFGLSCRDQETAGNDPGRLARRRREGHALAEAMVEAAKGMLAALQALHTKMGRFNEVTKSNPGLLESIFDVDLWGPGNLILPDGLAILETCFRSELDDMTDGLREADDAATDIASWAVPFKPCPAGFWEEVDDRLAAVIALPVRSALTSGPVPNIVLRSALRRVRRYWVNSLGRAWTTSALRYKQVRHANIRANLTGPCERFVVDALETGGIRFSLPELNSAWNKTGAQISTA